MKIGIRKTNIKKSVKARTTGKLKRQIKKSTVPLYGEKGTGIAKDPNKAIYNAIYSKVTIDPIKPARARGEKKMRKITGKEIYNWCKQNNWGEGSTERQAIKHFDLAASHLDDNEKILCAFIGLHEERGFNYAFLATDKRIMMSQKKIIGEEVINVLWDNLNDVSLSVSTLKALLTFDTIKERFSVWFANKDTARAVHIKMLDVVKQMKKPAQPTVNTASTLDEIKKLKELLDIGAITQEEFDIKKKELLGL